MRRTVLLLAATLLALVVFSGVALAVTKSCEVGVECFGTRKADTLNGTSEGDYVYGRGRGDTLNGFHSVDSLYGQGGPDKLFGGGDHDFLTGGLGNDALSGGDGFDNYYFGDGWGKDSITDSNAFAENMVHFVKGPEKDEEVPVTADLTIKLFSGNGPEVTNASGTNTIEWESHAIAHVESGAGDDHITGNFSDNIIYGHSGADTISASAGNDEIHVFDGSGDDVVDCGENLIPGTDSDTVYHDSGDTIDPNCEEQYPGG